MKNLFIISEEERKKILNLHENASNKKYLSEQQTTGTTATAQNNQGVMVNFNGTNITVSYGDKSYTTDGTKTLNDVRAMFPGQFPLPTEKPNLETQNVPDTGLPSPPPSV